MIGKEPARILALADGLEKPAEWPSGRTWDKMNA